MAGPAILKIDIVADASKAQRALQGTAQSSQGLGSKLKSLGGAVATGFAVGKVIEFGKASLDAAQESQKATSRLEQVFRSMGDTTGTAAKAAEDYAGALSRKIGVDDEAIMSGQAILATFSAVSDATARQAGIFDRATGAAADLAAAGFGTLESNSVQLGKALQDPTKGITALARSGVTFTDAQKAQIKVLQESGDQLGAQKIVLGAVEKQVKGTAAATATSSEKMAVAFGETQEAVGKALLPILAKLAPILMKLAGFIEHNVSWLLPLAAVLGVLAIAYQIATVATTLFGVSTLAALWPILLVIAAIAAVIAIGILLAKNWDTIKAAAAAVWAFMQRAWDAILGVIQKAWGWIKANWPLLLAILTGPVGIAVAIIVTKWSAIRAGLQAVWNWIRTTWVAVASFLAQPFLVAWQTVQTVIGWISGAVQSAIGIASSIAGALKGPINAVLRAWNGIEFKVPEVNVGPIHFGGQTIGLPDVPLLAQGGSVLRTGLAIVHAGEQFSGVGKSFGGGSTVINVSVTTTGLGADAPQIQRAVVNSLRGYTDRNGPLDIPVRSVA